MAVLCSGYYDALELGKKAGWFLEPTDIWTYGEGCECGCKFIASSAHSAANGMREEKHFRSINQAVKFFTKTDRELAPARAKLAAEQAAQWEQLKLLKGW